jgi:hypothetical protein
VTDADLMSLGVDSAMLPIVRLLATDVHLEELQPVQPEVQYTALFAQFKGAQNTHGMPLQERYGFGGRAG